MHLQTLFPVTIGIFKNNNHLKIENSLVKECKKIKNKIKKGGNNWDADLYNTSGTFDLSESEKFKKDAISTNFEAIKMLKDLADKKKKIIYMTSNSGYGIGQKGKYCDENSPLNPISLYGITKCDAENEVVKNKNTISKKNLKYSENLKCIMPYTTKTLNINKLEELNSLYQIYSIQYLKYNRIVK